MYTYSIYTYHKCWYTHSKSFSFFYPILWQHSVRNSLSKVYEVVLGAMLQAEPTELGAWYHWYGEFDFTNPKYLGILDISGQFQ